MALSHGLYNSGLILPVKEIGNELQKENIPYFLDTAQTVGCIGEFDFADTGCDFMSFNGSKWLCGPMGTGVFYCKRESSDLLEPSNIGGETAETNENGELTYKELPDRFQAGFRNYESERTSIVSFEIEKQDPEKIVSELSQKGIIIAKREIYEKPVLRISPHIYNTKDEILSLVEELKKL